MNIDIENSELKLIETEEGLTLTDGKLQLRGDFRSMLPRIRPGALQRELLVKAAKFKKADHPLKAVDATAGLGEDSFLLAAAGYDVTLFEQDQVIALLLEDALLRARKDPELAEYASRMHLIKTDSIEGMKHLTEKPDLIYLDPMFPERQKSGLVKKKFQLLQKLESPCTDGEELLKAAMEAEPSRIVIKRMLKGPLLGGIKPSYSIKGKTIRFDISYRKAMR
jgi:16S rRNA (guanine1516-N2)-methyltransferase